MGLLGTNAFLLRYRINDTTTIAISGSIFSCTKCRKTAVFEMSHQMQNINKDAEIIIFVAHELYINCPRLLECRDQLTFPHYVAGCSEDKGKQYPKLQKNGDFFMGSLNSRLYILHRKISVV